MPLFQGGCKEMRSVAVLSSWRQGVFCPQYLHPPYGVPQMNTWKENQVLAIYSSNYIAIPKPILYRNHGATIVDIAGDMGIEARGAFVRREWCW